MGGSKIQLLKSGLTSGQTIAKIAAYAGAGGTLSVLQGGKFGHGFVSAGFTEALSPAVGQIEGDGFGSILARTAASAAIGGTASTISGGNFANGASTAAFQYLFNQAVHRYELGPTRMCWSDQSGCIRGNALMATDPVSVPFSDNPVEGRMVIGPYNDPIEHRVNRLNQAPKTFPNIVGP